MGEGVNANNWSVSEPILTHFWADTHPVFFPFVLADVCQAQAATNTNTGSTPGQWEFVRNVEEFRLIISDAFKH